ncbi:MAG: phytoene desaturase family protein [Rectinema subterraneum]|uniref:phytoene desaturase family protein n=1 Tax=Rectinema subterraneum TaxID=2653714 RepID=UPI003C7BD589
MTEKHTVIVVGGGIAGLTAAAYVAKKGADVLLIEKNATCGGLINTFSRDGFVFDGGVRALESAGIIKPMLADLQIDLPSIKSNVSIGIANDIINVESEADLTAYEQLLLRFYPDSSEDISRLMDVIKNVMKNMKILYAVDNPLFKNFKEDGVYFVKNYVPWMFKFLIALRNIDAMKGPVEEFLATIIKNQSLMDIVDQHFFAATPTFFAMSYFYLYTDYFYPKGGVGTLPLKVQEKLVSFGGKIRTKTRIEKLDPAARTLTDAEGTIYQYEKLIWAADLKHLYSIADTTDLPEEAARKITKEKDLLLSRKGAESIFTLFMAVDLPPEEFKKISHGHFFYTPSPVGLGETHRSELKYLLETWDTVSVQTIFSWLDRFCELNTYEISIPVLKDAQAAPPGKTGVIASLLFEYELVKRIKEAGWYEEFKTHLEAKMIDVLTASIYPGLKEHLVFKFSASPLSIEELVGSSGGAIIGWSFKEPVPVTSSMLGVNDSIKTTIPDVFKAGQWSYSPTGVPTSIMTGRLAADAAIKALKVRKN